MTIHANGAGDSANDAQTATRKVRPLLWSIRRELWENRSLTIAPAIVAATLCIGYMISTIGLPQRRRALLLLDPTKQRSTIGLPMDVAAMLFIATAFVVGAFYCIDALQSDRRDRSILFWKSLPVSDRTTVLSKIAIPLVVLPLLTFAITIATQLFMMLWSTLLLLPSGLASSTWTRFDLFEQSLVLVYGLVVLALWHAPIYALLLLISGWAKRAAALWVILPPLILGMLERVALKSSHVSMLIRSRLVGGIREAFDFNPRGAIDKLSQLTPGQFLSTPGLWIGLLFAVAFIVAAVKMRGNREPI